MPLSRVSLRSRESLSTAPLPSRFRHFPPCRTGIVLILLLAAPTWVYADRRLFSKSRPEVQDIVASEDGTFFCVGFFSGTLARDDRENSEPIAKSAGGSDAFLARFSAEGDLLWFAQLGGPLTDEAQSAALAPDGALVVTGYFQGKVDFAPGETEAILESKPKETAQFVAKYTLDGSLIWAHSAGKRSGLSTRLRSASHGVAGPVTRVRVVGNGNVHVLSTLEGTADLDPGEDLKIVDTGKEWKSILAVYDSSGGYVEHATTRPANAFVPVEGGWILAGENACTYESPETDGLLWALQRGGQEAWSHRWSGKPYLQYDRAPDGSPEVFNTRASIEDLALGKNGGIYTTGYIQGVVDFDPDQRSKTDTIRSQLANRIGFLAVFAPNGKFLGATPIDAPSARKSEKKYGAGTLCTAIGIDKSGTVFVTGGCEIFSSGQKVNSVRRTSFVAMLRRSRIAWMKEHHADGAYAVSVIPDKGGVLIGGTAHQPPKPGKKARTIVSMGRGAFVAGYSPKGKQLRSKKKKR